MKIFSVVLFFLTLHCYGQEDTLVIQLPLQERMASEPVKIFHSQKLINAKTTEVLGRGVMEFQVSHHFGDVGGDAGGISRFFGLDQATDVKIAFQTGIAKNLNLLTARTRGAGQVQQQWELGLKWQVMQQEPENGAPLAITLFANNVVSAMKAIPSPGFEASFENFSSRKSQIFQVLLARKFGGTGIQVHPTLLHTNHVVANDKNTLFAIGAGIRLPVSKKLVLIGDWFHTFRDEATRNYFSTQGIEFRDAIGIGMEILTEGHVFHLNFTNATELLENRFLRRTVSDWGEGQFRWAFTISRRFVLWQDKMGR